MAGAVGGRPPSRAKRRRRPRETFEIAAMTGRMIRSLAARVGGEDPVDLQHLVAVRDAADAAVRDAVAGQLRSGFSWAEIAEGLGIARQTAQERFGGVRGAA